MTTVIEHGRYARSLALPRPQLRPRRIRSRESVAPKVIYVADLQVLGFEENVFDMVCAFNSLQFAAIGAEHHGVMSRTVQVSCPYCSMTPNNGPWPTRQGIKGA